MSEITAPHRQLHKSENDFKWDPHVHGLAFDQIRNVLSNTPVLRYFDEKKEHCNAIRHNQDLVLAWCKMDNPYVMRREH